MNNVAALILSLPVLLFSIVIHEYFHAYVAKKAGDMTATYLGRLTLNPIAHIDPIGTILLPMLMLLFHFPLFGWARPVPINPLRFKNSDWIIWVSLAGVTANFSLVIAAVLIAKLLILSGVFTVYDFINYFYGTSMVPPIVILLGAFIQINLLLGVFNLIPIPPLDGSRVVYQILTKLNIDVTNIFNILEQFGFVILLILLNVGIFEKILLPVLSFSINLILHIIK